MNTNRETRKIPVKTFPIYFIAFLLLFSLLAFLNPKLVEAYLSYEGSLVEIIEVEKELVDSRNSFYSKILDKPASDELDKGRIGGEEVISERTAHSKTFQNGDGTQTTRIYQDYLHFRNELGVWQEIDTSIELSHDPEYKYQMADSIYNALHGAHPNFKIYRKEETPEYLHYRNHRRISPLVGIPDESWFVTTHYHFDNYGFSGYVATHGYDPSLSSMQAIFLASGPHFKKGIKVPKFQNIHIYNLMAYILEIGGAANDGNLEQVRAMLVNE